MPIHTFWLFQNNIHRIQAASDIRAMRIGMSVQSADGSTALRESLIGELGNVGDVEHEEAMPEERDEEGFKHLMMTQ